MTSQGLAYRQQLLDNCPAIVGHPRSSRVRQGHGRYAGRSTGRDTSRDTSRGHCRNTGATAGRPGTRRDASGPTSWATAWTQPGRAAAVAGTPVDQAGTLAGSPARAPPGHQSGPTDLDARPAQAPAPSDTTRTWNTISRFGDPHPLTSDKPRKREFCSKVFSEVAS